MRAGRDRFRIIRSIEEMALLWEHGLAHPGIKIKIKILENLGRGLSRKLRKTNVELSVFE